MYQTVKGTYDILPDEYEDRKKLKDLFKDIIECYGYRLMETPVFENAGVFQKENDTSDMVTKEMYAFSPNGKDNLILRPEGTAGVIRSVVQNKMYSSNELPLKLGYIGEMFRHERPQKGRQRQFTQLGVENIGDKSPIIDAEIISLAYNYIDVCGIDNIKVLINTLGDNESRIKYKKALYDYFLPYKDKLCVDCQNRLEKNPLRILDCKVDHELDIIKKAPKMIDYLSPDAKKYFDDVKKYLDEVNIKYEIDDTLVRGLDYYTDTVFELVSTSDNAGAQATILAGGRYDNLIEEMGGPKISGIGFACGLERLNLMVKEENESINNGFNLDFYIINMSADANYAFKVSEKIRSNLLNVEMNIYPRSLKAQFKSAERRNPKFIIIIGDDEVKAKTLTIKNNSTKEQVSIKFEDIEDYISNSEELKNV